MDQSKSRIDWRPEGAQIGGGLLKGVERGFKTAGRTML